ncbi:MAG: CDP-alcohol phosphatidyltransferase family protein [Candidatus Thermoplasmatota archaeon]|nr:CDP-alcohol phosphatidyltransferase family protein [Candidatus Thermoplasmatota archaeon]
MALEKLRNIWERALNPIVESMSWMSPATITWLALPIGILGGLSVFLASEDSLGVSMLFGGGLLITLAMAFDGLDGPVARATGRVTRWGDYLDHTFDRLLDAVWIVSISASVFVDALILGLSAAWFTLLGSYMGTQAQAVAGSRNYRGFSRADRTILCIVAIFLMGILLYFDSYSWGSFPWIFDHIRINPLSIVVFISALGGIWTFLIRFIQASQQIKQIDAEDPLPQPSQPVKESD